MIAQVDVLSSNTVCLNLVHVNNSWYTYSYIRKFVDKKLKMTTKYYKLEEVSKNNGKNGSNVWIIVKYSVYDVTEYLKKDEVKK